MLSAFVTLPLHQLCNVDVMVANTSDSESGDEKGYNLPASPPSIPLRPAKAVEREDSPDEIEALDSLPTIAVPPLTSRKRGAPQDGDVSLGAEQHAGKRARPSGEAAREAVIEIE